MLALQGRNCSIIFIVKKGEEKRKNLRGTNEIKV